MLHGGAVLAGAQLWKTVSVKQRLLCTALEDTSNRKSGDDNLNPDPYPHVSINCDEQPVSEAGLSCMKMSNICLGTGHSNSFAMPHPHLTCQAANLDPALSWTKRCNPPLVEFWESKSQTKPLNHCSDPSRGTNWIQRVTRN